jgi:hypothetical protein
LLHRFRATFPLPPTGVQPFDRRRSYLEWRVYQVTEAPRLLFADLDGDGWMYDRAVLLVRGGADAALGLRFSGYIPPGPYENALTVSVGARRIASCPAAPRGVSECTLDLAFLRGGASGDWTALDLRAERTFSPKLMGIGEDPRNFSFNFGPMRAGDGERRLASARAGGSRD